MTKINDEENGKMILTAEGCVDSIMHHGVQFGGMEEGYQLFVCPKCNKIVEREADDAGSGC
jgi:hypothetical protein